MIGMATRTSERKPKASTATSKDLSPSKVLAIVANWNNTSPAAVSPKRKRSRGEKLSASVPRSRRQKTAIQRGYLSASSDDDEVPSFKANSFYHNAKRTRYLSPYERREQLDRLIDAGVDPKSLDRSRDDPPKNAPKTHSTKSTENRKGTSIASSREKMINGKRGVRTPSASGSTRGAASVKKAATFGAHKPNGVTVERTQGCHGKAAAAEKACQDSSRGEIKVTLSERFPSGGGGEERRSSPRKAVQANSVRETTTELLPLGGGERQRCSPRKAKGSPTPAPAPASQWRRTSPRKSVLKNTAVRGIQMYVSNLKGSQKKFGKKAELSKQKSKEKKSQPKDQTKTRPKVSCSSPVTVSLSQDLTTAEAGNTTSARGLDFGTSLVNAKDVAPLDKSHEQDSAAVGDISHDGSELMDFLIFRDDDFQEEDDDDAGRQTQDFVQSLLLEIDGDVEAAEAAIGKPPSPRKRKMKTEQESMSASPSSSSGTPSRRRMSSTPVSSKKSKQPRLDEWLTQQGAKAPSSPLEGGGKKSAVPRSKVASEGTVAMTPESSESSSPKVPAVSTPDKPVRLYPVFTPPTSPHARSGGTPTAGRNRGAAGKARTPKETRRSPLLKSLKAKNDPLEQMTLDLGQKRYGAVTCATCGTVYTAAHPEDEADHARFHKKYLSGIKFPGWKQEEVLEEYHDGRVIVVTHDAPRYAEKKVEEIKELVDRELGFLEANPLASKDLCKTYIFVTVDKKVGGCLIAEQITKGYRVIVEEQRAASDAGVQDSQRAWCCETEPEPALCGISRVWVPMATRRKGVASRLLDCVRKNFMFGTILSPDDIAFSDPTPDGKIFATKYTGTPRFLVYKYH